MAKQLDRTLIPSGIESGEIVRVDMKPVMDAALKEVDEAIAIMRPVVKVVSDRISMGGGEDKAEAMNNRAILDTYASLMQSRCRLAAEQAKSLVEMQKSINHAAIEKMRMTVEAAKKFDLSRLSDSEIKMFLEQEPDKESA